MDTRDILRNGLNKHVTIPTRVIYNVELPNDTVQSENVAQNEMAHVLSGLVRVSDVQAIPHKGPRPDR